MNTIRTAIHDYFTMPNLKPEHERMVNVFLSNFSCFDSYQATIIEHISIEDVVTHNNTLFVLGKVGRKTLPHEPAWVWNQSKSKTKIVLNPYEQIILAKLNPRKHSKSSAGSLRPPYKLWDCEIHSPRTKGKEIHFLWVEKGKESANSPVLFQQVFDFKNEVPNCTTEWEMRFNNFPTSRKCIQPKESVTESSAYNKDLNILDFSFLKDFVEPQIASQFGWY